MCFFWLLLFLLFCLFRLGFLDNMLFFVGGRWVGDDTGIGGGANDGIRSSRSLHLSFHCIVGMRKE